MALPPLGTYDLPPQKAQLPMGTTPRPQTPPVTAPNIPPMNPPAPFNFAAPGGGATSAAFTGTAPTPTPYGPFTGKAPTATPFGDFTAPDPTKVAESPYYQFRLNEGSKRIERGAAARGTLLTGGLQNRLQEYGQGLASEEADNDYRRALDTYTTNRGTNAQNFGQEMGRFNADLAGYGANQGTNAQNFGQQNTAYQAALAGYDANLAGNAQSLDAATATYDRNLDATRTAYTDAAADATRRNAVTNVNAENSYADQMAEYQRKVREQADALAAQAAKDTAAKNAAAGNRGSGWRG